MTEGELKKRIRNAWNNDLELNEQEYDVSLALISLILDEAKQEFPIINEEFLEHKRQITKEVLFATIKARDEWFKKWFGSAEEK